MGQDNPHDLVLTDLKMPHMNGVEFTQWRAIPQLRRCAGDHHYLSMTRAPSIGPWRPVPLIFSPNRSTITNAGHDAKSAPASAATVDHP